MRVLGRIFSVFLGIFLGILFMEVLLRTFFPIPDYFWRGYNPYFGIEVIREYNHLLFRDKDHSFEKPSGVKRIEILGDSIAEGWGVRFEQTFWRIMQRKLGKDVEIINLSRHGINTWREVKLFEKYGLGYKPDLIILAYCLNDTWEYERGPAYMWYLEKISYKKPHGFYKYLIHHLTVFRLIYKFLEDKNVKRKFIKFTHRTYKDRWPGYIKVIKAFERLRRLTRGRIPVVVVIFPYLQVSLRKYPFLREHRKVIALCRSHGFYWIDLLPFLRRYNPASLMADKWRDAHPNWRVHRIAANVILDFIKREKLLNMR